MVTCMKFLNSNPDNHISISISPLTEPFRGHLGLPSYFKFLNSNPWPSPVWPARNCSGPVFVLQKHPASPNGLVQEYRCIDIDVDIYIYIYTYSQGIYLESFWGDPSTI